MEAPFEPVNRNPSSVPRLRLSDRLDVRFQGFSEEAFAVLERLRAHPHIEQYQADRQAIRACLKEPFKIYRDDLVVNVVLPNRLNLETERNVFSRLLKNDFGAGGCHHHYWMSFYRKGLTRLRDLQLAHSLHPAGLRIAVIARNAAKPAWNTALSTIKRHRRTFLQILQPLLSNGCSFITHCTSGTARVIEDAGEIPESFERAKSIRVVRTFPADRVVRRAGAVVEDAATAMHELWPLYHFLFGAQEDSKICK